MNNYQTVSELFHKMQGCKAKIWSFESTLSRLVLRLWYFDNLNNEVKNEIYIAVLGCERIEGPFWWENAHLELEQNEIPNTQELQFVISDKSADFELISSGGLGLVGTGPPSYP